MQHLILIPLALPLLAAYFTEVAYCDLRDNGQQFLNDIHQDSSDQKAELVFSQHWQVLGPFCLGTRESIWGADPLEQTGGFRSLQFDPRANYTSSLADNGTVKWTAIDADTYSSENCARSVLSVNFPGIDWPLIQSVYGWSALQYQAWVRGSLIVNSKEVCTAALYTDNVLEFYLDGKHYFGGDAYSWRRAPVLLKLAPGPHVLDLRLIRDVRAAGGLGKPDIVVDLKVETRHEHLKFDQNSLLMSEAVEGNLGSGLCSIIVQNNGAATVDILSITSEEAPQHHVNLESTVRLAAYQARPLRFNVVLGVLSTERFTADVIYRINERNATITAHRAISVQITDRNVTDAQRFTFSHPAGIVSYAVLRPPPPIPTCTALEAVPIIVALHGAGVEADSVQVRHMLNAAQGICAWTLFPSGVTSWSGDDWHHWGAADVVAAIAAIPAWAESVGYVGPRALLEDWIVTGHSNGDNVVAAAPVSGYSSIQSKKKPSSKKERKIPRADLADYVPYTFWTEAEPSLSHVLQNALLCYKHELLVENLAGIPILQQHGSRDNNVPPYHSRLMHELLERVQWPSQYNELAGKGHWFDGVMETPPLLHFFDVASNISGHPPLPQEFTIVIPPSGMMGPKFGISIDQLRTPDRIGKVKVTRLPGNNVWHLETQNILRFSISPGSMRAQLPSTLIMDGGREKFNVNEPTSNRTWFVRNARGDWATSADVGWQTRQRHGRQQGALDAILRSHGSFTIEICSEEVEDIALQISRNFLQYYAADSYLATGCNGTQHSTQPTSGEPRRTTGNVITLAIGNTLSPSENPDFPLRIGNDRLLLSRAQLPGAQRPQGRESEQLAEQSYSVKYEYEPGLGTIFIRPRKDEGLELVVWGADIHGLRQAARLVPTLTGGGQPDFMVLSDRSRWKGAAGLYAAGFFDANWQISAASYVDRDFTFDED